MAKGKHKLQYQNQHDDFDRRFGNKQWLPVYNHPHGHGYSMTREQASDLYHELRWLHPSVTYRIMECR